MNPAPAKLAIAPPKPPRALLPPTLVLAIQCAKHPGKPQHRCGLTVIPGTAIFLPLTFTELTLHPSLLQGIKELGFVRPTPIQAESIPPGLDGRDLLACAQTGSGKTAAFLLPILNKLIDRPRGTTRALVLAPTRELAQQILDDMKDLAMHTPVTGAAIYGGVGMGPQEHALRSGVDVIIACPGRLLDHLKSHYAKLDKIEFLVLDEADRMLDMGFLPEIKKILRALTHKRQTMFFSATMPPPIQALTREMLHSPVAINQQRQAAPAAGITQAVYPVRSELKQALLLEILKRGIMKQALVFTRTKHRANRLAEFLVNHGINADRIHGNRSQPQRMAALAGFKSGKYPVLVATDIAARGIDVDSVSHVINYDLPHVPESYVHRIGRTARAGADGSAIAFCTPEDRGLLRDIEKTIRAQVPVVEHALGLKGVQQLAPTFGYDPAKAKPNGSKPHHRGQKPNRNHGSGNGGGQGDLGGDGPAAPAPQPRR